MHRFMVSPIVSEACFFAIDFISRIILCILMYTTVNLEPDYVHAFSMIKLNCKCDVSIMSVKVFTGQKKRLLASVGNRSEKLETN